jgi:enterobacterial common antigen flippase
MTSISCEVQTESQPALSEPVQAAESEKNTHGQILKSSAMVGGSSVLNIFVGMIRTKAIAVLLGPAGFGLFGLFGSIATLTQTFAGMGVNSSGVRQIAAAISSGDTELVAQTAVVLRRISLLLGLIGAVLLALFSRQISVLSFGSAAHTKEVALLSIAVFFSSVSAGQGALIQGMRRIPDLAKMSVLGAIYGSLISVSLVYFLRSRGVAPALVVIALMTTATSWWYSRKIRIHIPSMSAADVIAEAAALLKLGFAFMSSGLMTMGVAYVVRIVLLHKVGYSAIGLYQSAWTLGGLYVGFILQAMGADFYPRLTASAHDNTACNRLVNEQAQVGLLLAGPGVIATLTFAPVVIALFYSTKFGAAVGMLRWICLGSILQVVTWPMGFIIVAKAKKAIFIGCEVAWSIVSLGLAWVSISYFGLNGVGIAFFGSYVFHGFMIYAVVRKLSGYRWSSDNRRRGSILLSLVGLVFCGFYLLPFFWAVCLGACSVVLSSVYSFRVLSSFVTAEQIFQPLRRMFPALGRIWKIHKS